MSDISQETPPQGDHSDTGKDAKPFELPKVAKVSMGGPF